MRILCIIESLGYGGAERLLVSLLPELSKKINVQFEVAGLGQPYHLAEDLENYGIKVHRLDMFHRWSAPEIVYKLNRLCRNTEYDILWGHLYFGNLYAMLVSIVNPKTKVVLTLHSPGPNFLDSPSKSFLRQTWQYIRMKIEQVGGYYLADRIIAVSNAVAGEYERLYKWKDIGVVYNGIPTKLLPSDINADEWQRVRSFFGVSENEFLLVLPGRYAEQKGHTVLLKALSLLAVENRWRPHCIMAGEGLLKDEIKKEAITLGLNGSVHLIPPLPQSKLFKLMQAANTVVIPSLREPFGIAAAESMALGIPTILSRVDGLQELAGNTEAALMVHPNDPQSLADALWRLYSEPEIRDKLRLNGKKRIYDNFDISKTALRWVKVFSDIVSVSG